MTTFAAFSDAAILYARHEAVVDAMYQRLKDDAGLFWTAVRDELTRRLAPQRVELSNTSGYTYLRLKREGIELASAWVQRADGRLVREAKVLVGFGIANAALVDAGVAVVEAAAQGLEPAAVRRKQKPSASTLFEFDLTLNSQDLVTSICDRLEPTLRSLAEIVPPAP